jgi:hypothetical protein
VAEVSLGNFDSALEAEMVCRLLMGEGIPCYPRSFRNPLWRPWFSSRGGFAVVVAQEHAERAKEIVDAGS